MVPEVRAGAKFLDETQPGWVDLIDLERLDIESGCQCVAAQVVGGFEGGHSNAWEYAMHEWAILHLDVPEEAGGVDYQRAADLGFLGEGQDRTGASWSDLQDGWVELIEERRS